MYYLWAILLILGSLLAWLSTLFTLPGSWIILGFTTLFALLSPFENGRGVSWITVAVVLVLAILGEVVEFAAGAAGAAKQGGSRRGIALALLGTMLGSVAGAIVGVPVPVAGPILGALGGGAAGAFAGAYLGDLWKGRTSQESLAVGKAALVGRLLGTVGKLAVGAAIVVIVAIDALR